MGILSGIESNWPDSFEGKNTIFSFVQILGVAAIGYNLGVNLQKVGW